MKSGGALSLGTLLYALTVSTPDAAAQPSSAEKDISGSLHVKSSSSAVATQGDLSRLAIEASPGIRWTPSSDDKAPWIELSWADYRSLSRLLLKPGPGGIGQIAVSWWDDKTQKWSAPHPHDLNSQAGQDSCVVGLTGTPPTRRLLLNFNNGSGLPEIRGIKLYAVPEIEENWQASWIWFTKERIEHIDRYFRKKFIVDGEIEKALLQGTGDDCVVFYINGRKVVSSADWKLPIRSEVSSFLVPGENIIAAMVHQDRYAAGLLAELDIIFKNGKTLKVVTDESWRSSDTVKDDWIGKGYDDSSWAASLCLGTPPEIWGKIPYVLGSMRNQIALRNNPLPSSLEAGQSVGAVFELSMPSGVGDKLPIHLAICRNGRLFARWKLQDDRGPGGNASGGRIAFKVEFRLSPLLYPGDYEFTLQAPYCEVTSAGKEWRPTIHIANNRAAKPLTAEVRKINGVPAMHVDGKPIWSMGYTSIPSFKLQSVDHQAYADVGVRIVQCYVNPESPAEGEYDFSKVDCEVVSVCEDNPDALIILKPGFRDCVPAWFNAKYPDELSVLDAGRRLSKPSLASLKWRLVAGDMLRNMIRHVNGSPYADKVIGYFVREGEEGQWMHYWGGEDLTKENILSDYSPAMRIYFSSWLKSKYHDTAALRQAWKDVNVDFDSAAIPGREARLAGQNGVFRDPQKSRPVIDYAEALSDVICDGIIHYAQLVKEETNRKALMLAFYGHIIDLGGGFLGEQVGYLKQRRVIDCPDLDCVAGPISYAKAFRDIAGVGSFDYPAPSCLRLRNKIWLNEDDVRTHLDAKGYAYSVRDAQQTDQVLAREFAKALCGGAGLYWLNLNNDRHWFDDRQSMLTIGVLNKIGQDAVNDNLSSISEIAVIMSDRSLLYLKPNGAGDDHDRVAVKSIFQRKQIGQIGAPFDEYLVDDLLEPAMPDYKLYIFLNAFYLTDQERQAVIGKLHKTGSTALWFYAPGYVTNNGFSVAGMERLTGIRIGMTPEPGRAIVSIPADNPLLPGYSGDIGMRDVKTQSPLFFADDPAAMVIGWLGVERKGGFVVKQHDGMTSYYCAAPGIPAALLREIAKKAGVHIYLDQEDAFYACKDYFAVHTSNKPGVRNITLPSEAEVEQLYPIRKDGVRTGSLSFESKSPETRIFRIRQQGGASP